MVLEIILGILAITLGYTTYNQMQKVERLETWAEEYAEKIVQAQEQIQEIDSEVYEICMNRLEQEQRSTKWF